MTRDLRADLDLPAARRPPPAAVEAARGRGPGHGSDVGVLGQEISHRLFSAGLDLDFALSMDGDGPAADRLRHAVAELDEAIKELRHLILAVSGTVPGVLSRDAGSRPG